MIVVLLAMNELINMLFTGISALSITQEIFVEVVSSTFVVFSGTEIS